MSIEDEAGFEQMYLGDSLLANFSSEFPAAPATWVGKKEGDFQDKSCLK